MTLEVNDRITDSLDDDVGKCLLRLRVIPTLTAEKADAGARVHL